MPPPDDNTVDGPGTRAVLVQGDKDFTAVTETVVAFTEQPKPSKAWIIAFLLSASVLGMLGLLIGYLVFTGVGIWGNNSPVMWGFPITNFVFWVGIGHAGTLISAILFLFRQRWRTGINRFAEAMTIFAVMCAGLFPAIHVGRPWLAYWMFPYPNQMGTWPNFRSPLLWDVFAVSTYAVVSVMFWYVGMIPDLATLRDRATTKWRQLTYGLFALGWRGTNRHWHRFEKTYMILAALATPLVLSVHSVVSFDFAVAQVPGWHTTIFPPYFVAGAIFSGFAMVLTLAIPCRKWFGLTEIITMRHIDNICKVMLATSCIVGYAYGTELFISWYSGAPFEQFAFLNRARGSYSWAYAIMVGCNVIIPQLLWSKRMRRHLVAIMVIAILVNVGMWFERFVIIMSLSRDFLPSSWQDFAATWVDIAMLIGSFGLFFTFFLLFLRFLPVVAMAEVKGVMPKAHAESDHDFGPAEYRSLDARSEDETARRKEDSS
ncbi:MAG: hydrogenase [Planctomycetaceae bacterium]|nr:hydrogenase [Planctomycetaceae bacterium]